MTDVTTTITIHGSEGDRFPPQVGDYVLVRSDVLAEVRREAAGLPPTWQFVPADTRGKLLGWRDGEDPGEEPRAVVEILEVSPRLVVFVADAKVARSAPMVEHPHRFRRLRRAG